MNKEESLSEALDTRNALLLMTGVEREVCKMIAERQQLGIQKYGQSVAENPLTLREWLQHALEETLDKAIYLKRAINEIDAKQAMIISQREPQAGVLRLVTADDEPLRGELIAGDLVYLSKHEDR